MGQDTQDFWEPMCLQDVEEFKGFLDVLSLRHYGLRDNSLTISNPKLPSIMSRTRSTTFPRSIILLRSLPHSMKVILLVFPDTTVIGPCGSLRLCLVYLFTNDRIKVDFPTPGGPTNPTMIGGGGNRPSSIPLPFSFVTFLSSGLRLTRGTCNLC